MKLYYMSTNGWNAVLAIDGDSACYYTDSYEDENVVDENGEIIAYYPARHPDWHSWDADEYESAAKKYLAALADWCSFGDFLPGTWEGPVSELNDSEWPTWEADVVAEYDTEAK